jgi:epsilon-lactone hydrolase
MPSRESQRMKTLLSAQLAPLFRGEVPIAAARAFFEAISAEAPRPPGIDIEEAEGLGVVGEWLRPRDGDDGGVILYVHGGAFVLGSRNTHRQIASQIAIAARARALVVDYRLAPEHPFPAGLDDAVRSYRALLDAGVDARRIVIAGDSAGGGLALAALVALREAGCPLPAGAVLLSPWTDLALSGPSHVTRAAADPLLATEGMPGFVRAYLGDRDPRTPLASPLYADLAGLPPLFVQVGDDEVLLDDATRVATRAEAASVKVTLEVWEGMWHVFQQTAARVPEAREAVLRIGAFVRERVAAR